MIPHPNGLEAAASAEDLVLALWRWDDAVDRADDEAEARGRRTRALNAARVRAWRARARASRSLPPKGVDGT